MIRGAEVAGYQAAEVGQVLCRKRLVQPGLFAELGHDFGVGGRLLTERCLDGVRRNKVCQDKRDKGDPETKRTLSPKRVRRKRSRGRCPVIPLLPDAPGSELYLIPARSIVQTGLRLTSVTLSAVATFLAGCSNGMKGPLAFIAFWSSSYAACRASFQWPTRPSWRDP